MSEKERDFFGKNSFAVMGDTRRMRDAVKGLKMMGKPVYFVDPSFVKDEGKGRFPRLSEVPDKVEAAICDGPSSSVQGYLNELADAGVKSVWINYQSDAQSVVEYARDKNFDLLHGQCAVLWLPTKGPHHSVHRFIWKLLGRY